MKTREGILQEQIELNARVVQVNPVVVYEDILSQLERVSSKAMLSLGELKPDPKRYRLCANFPRRG